MKPLHKNFQALLLLSALALIWSAPPADAAAKKKPPPPPPAENAGKRVLALAPVERVRIEMPDNQIRDFGDDFLAKLQTRFTQENRFILMDPEPEPSTKRFRVQPSLPPQRGYEWESHPVPAATVRVTVRELSFVTGSRGGRMFYGFDERLRNRFNDGSGALLNEFPVDTTLTGAQQPSWFDGTFFPQGKKPFDSLTGLDLGDGFGLDALFAWLRVKYARYRAQLGLTLHVEAPLAGIQTMREIQVSGKGYFYDVAGGYAAWDGAIRIARRDAMLKAFHRAFEQASHQIKNSIGLLPLTARIDAVGADGTVFLATGRQAFVAPGTKYVSLYPPAIELTVTESHSAGSLAELSFGDPQALYPGLLLRELSAQFPPQPTLRLALASGTEKTEKAAPTSLQLEGIIVDLPAENLPQPNFGGSVRDISRVRAFFLSLVETIFLPYRIWRYHQYDRSYRSKGDDFADSIGKETNFRSAREWARATLSEPWARRLGLSELPPNNVRHPVVAVIDSGIDYNHPVLHESLWINPNPLRDSHGRIDRYGWDFISGDSRPYDDGYHGTRVASALLGVAPHARIMPLKVFNPWGITSSAAILAAFHYAIDHGAEVILCAWSTRFHSQALEEGIALAAERNIPVIAAAGDLGRDLRIAHAYPAALAPRYGNLIIVTAVDSNGKLLALSNTHPTDVHLAIPGHQIRVADPRKLETRASSTSLAAAIAAGLLLRTVAEIPSEEASLRDWRRELEDATAF